MKLYKRSSLILSCAIILAGTALAPVQAQSNFAENLNEEKVKLIRQNCVGAQVLMQQFRRSDVVSRTNRGRGYEEILQLMAALNSRLALNKLNEPRMTELTFQLQQAFSDFYKHYTDYEISLGKAISAKCVDQPVTFYEHVSQAREQRGQLKKDVDVMQRMIDEYQVEYTKLKQKTDKSVPQQPEEQQ